MSPSVSQQYDKENKLHHFVISDVWYFDDNTDECFPAKVEFFGYSFKIETYKNGKPYNTIRGSRNLATSTDMSFSYRIIESDGMTVTLDETICGKLRLSLANFKILKAYFDEKNVVDIQAERVFRDEILSLLPKLLNNSVLMQLVSNFIENVPTAICIDPTLITCTESLIAIHAHRGNIGNSLFLSDELQRSAVTKLVRTEVKTSPINTTIREEFHVNHEEIIKPYLDDVFFLLVNLLKDRIQNVESVKAIYLTYAFLYKAMIRYFSQKWASEYSTYFGNIGDLTLSEAIQQYCLIETINLNNLQTAGTFLYYLIDHGKFEGDNYLLCFNLFVQQLNPILERQKAENFANKIKKPLVNRTYTINDIDLMNGQEFEQFLATLFSKMGYETAVTKSSGDQGIDVIASKGGIKIGIQAKCFSGSVGNGAIQEAVAGRNYYNLDKAIVVTNSEFTNSAKELAEANSVILWDRIILKEKIADL
jgi:hypothetical protein